ncbi:MAG: hypothetical protein H6832_18890 [Planctomycetes bacterium]|nr:hypothetical protein [Planctomycetota bacterium]MCB9920477.1 hypothetical protein [Planctomycetota bacterium]
MIDFDRSFGFYETVLRGITARQQVTSLNIANQSTPGYRTREVRFEEILQQALDTGTDPASVEFEPTVVGTLPLKADGNDVDLEREWMQMEANKLQHDIFARATGSSLRGIMTAIRSR